MPFETKKATKEIAETYKQLIKDKRNNYPIKGDETSYDHLLFMCQEIVDNYVEWPTHKAHRWLGYIQGVLTALKVIPLETHMDVTRDIVRKYGI